MQYTLKVFQWYSMLVTLNSGWASSYTSDFPFMLTEVIAYSLE
jgi:hypothetical protein